MPRRKRPSEAAPARPWKFTVGQGAYRVVAIEREDRDFEVYLRFNDPEKLRDHVPDARTLRPTGLFLRKSLDTACDVGQTNEAIRQATKRSLELQEGRYSTAMPSSEPEVITLERGIMLANDAESNNGRRAYRLDASGDPVLREHDKALRSRLRRFLSVWENNARKDRRVIPTFHTFTLDDAIYVARVLAREYSTKDTAGHSVVFKTLTDVFAVAAWLRTKRLIAHNECVMPKEWRAQIKQAWEETGGDTPEVNQPRHTEAELHLLWGALDDPRAALVRRLSLRRRHSPIMRLRWSDLQLDASPRAPHGTIRFRESPSNVYRSPITLIEQTMLISALTDGYLREYEQARCDGQLSDYHLFPQGALTTSVAGMAKVVRLELHGGIGGIPFEFRPEADGTNGSRTRRVARANVLTIDPRMKLLMDLGAAQRVGQVSTLTRRDLKLGLFRTDPTTDEKIAVGVAKVRGQGKKRAKPIALEARLLASVDDALEGYLCEFEQLYQAGKIENYPMFPGGQLKKGVADPANPESLKPITKGAARVWFRELERAAGVQSEHGRAWYGVRRILTDLAPTLTNDSVVLQHIASTSERMLDVIYRDRENRSAQVKAGQVWSQIRFGTDTPSPGARPPVAANPSDTQGDTLADLLSRATPEELASIALILRNKAAVPRPMTVDGHGSGAVEATA